MHRLRSFFALLTVLATSAPASATLKIVCFGDSITYGDFDVPDGFGYPGRLEDRLVTAGFDVDVVNAGLNGEGTAEAVTRVDSVLADHPAGDLFLLMEGTNDISGQVSSMSIAFHLDQIALKAEAAGYAVTHASLIPRYPCASADSLNAKTFTVSDLVNGLATDHARALVDVFGALYEELFFNDDTSMPNAPAFEYYYNNFSADDYLSDPDPSGAYCLSLQPNDPVGHPNAAHGYDRLTDLFESSVLAQLGGLVIVPPPSTPVGTVLSFGAQVFLDDFTELEWDFGDGGRATISPVGSDPSVEYMFLEPGPHTVTVTWKRSGGETGSASIQVTVSGVLPAWSVRKSLLTQARRGDAAPPDDLRFDLSLINVSGQPAVAEVELLPEPAAGEPIPLTALQIVGDGGALDASTTIQALRESIGAGAPSPRRFFLPDGATPTEIDLIAHRFGLDASRSAAKIRFYRTGGTSGQDVGGTLYRSPFPASGLAFPDVISEDWSSGARTISNLFPGGSTEFRLMVTNVTDESIPNGDTSVLLQLFDSSDALVGSHTLGVLRNGTTTATLAELFPALGSFVPPFRLELGAANRSYVASLLTVSSTTGEINLFSTLP